MKQDQNAKPWIGERTLTAESGPRKEVVVRLGLPEPALDGQEYRCPYEISGPEISVSRYSAGMDPIQSLQLAFVAIGGIWWGLGVMVAGLCFAWPQDRKARDILENGRRVRGAELVTRDEFNCKRK